MVGSFVVYHWPSFISLLLYRTDHTLKQAEKEDVGIDAGEIAERCRGEKKSRQEKGKAARRKESY
jgi:hypothetical protein